VGRQYTVGFRTEIFLDPFNHHYTSIDPLSSGAGTSLPAAAKTADFSAGISHRLTQPVELTAGVFRSDYDSLAGPGSRLVGIVDASYFLSKQTNLYVEFDANRYRGALIPSTKQTSQRGASLGVRHLF